MPDLSARLIRSSTIAVVLAVTLLASGPMFSNRWEGLAVEHQASPSWELRSFVASVEPYTLTTPVSLQVRYYVPDDTEAFLEAREVIPARSYLMEPNRSMLQRQTGWRTFDRWPTADVIIPNKIDSQNLGMLIRLGAASDAVTRYAPAFISYSRAPATATRYRLYVMTLSALRKFSYEVDGQNGYSRTYEHPPAGDRSTVLLEFDAAGIPRGWTTLTFSAGHEDLSLLDRVNVEVQFYHVPLS